MDNAMLTVNSISKTYGINTVLHNISFNLNPGEKAALVGPNGCGKSTLLRIITGEEQADSGRVMFAPPGLQPGYLPQAAVLPAGLTMGEALSRMQGDLPGLSRQLEELSLTLASFPDDPQVQHRFDACLARISETSEAASKAPAILAGFGLDTIPTDLPVSALSGGQKTRLLLAGVLLASPRLLLLDEPTNHLDIDMLEWLEDWLNRSNCTVLLVSHDRTFLDRVCRWIYELDPDTHTLTTYPGNYSAYLEQKAKEQARRLQAYTDQQDEIARLKDTARHIRGVATFRKGSKADSGDKFAKGFFANRSLGTVRRARAIEARVEKLLGENHIDKPRSQYHMKMELDGSVESGRDVVVLKDLSIGYAGIPLLQEINAVLRFGQRCVLTGPNGCGKSTLLRTIMGEIAPVQGSCRLGAGVKAGYITQEQEEFEPGLNTLFTFQRVSGYNETEARTFLHKYLFSGDAVFTPVESLSYGQRARLSLACLVVQGCNLLLLDEPLNHLDLPSRTQFESALLAFTGTVLTVTHDRYFIQRYATHVWEMKDGSLSWREMHPIL